MTDPFQGRDPMDDAQVRALFREADTWVTPRVDTLLAPLGMKVGDSKYEYTDLNKGRHHDPTYHRLQCAMVPLNQSDYVIKVDPVALRLRWPKATGVSLADFCSEIAAHEKAHVATKRDRPIGGAQRILAKEKRRAIAEMMQRLDDSPAVPDAVEESHQQQLFRRAHRLREAADLQAYAWEGLGRYAQAGAMTEGVAGRFTDRKDYGLCATNNPMYDDGWVMVATILDHPKLGANVLRSMLEATGAKLDGMATRFEAEFFLDRWSHRVRGVRLPELTFDQAFADKYGRNPVRTVDRLLTIHAKTGVMLMIDQAQPGERMPQPLANFVWDVGHIGAEVGGYVNPHEVLAKANHVFKTKDDEQRLTEFERLMGEAAEAARMRVTAARTAGDPMPDSVVNLSRSVRDLMQVEVQQYRSPRRAAIRSLLGL